MVGVGRLQGYFSPYRIAGRSWALAIVGTLLASITTPVAAQMEFRRGDTNADATLDLSDSISTLAYLFSGGAAPGCADAADSNDDGVLDLSDGINTLNYLFAGGSPIPAPGPEECGGDPTSDDLACAVYLTTDCPQVGPDAENLRIGHLLNRITYGPTQSEIDRARSIGISAYVDQQLHPESIDESENRALTTAVERLFTKFEPVADTTILPTGSFYRFRRGTSEPPADWPADDFDDSDWESGRASIGYGDGDDATILSDMRFSYVSVYLRTTFSVADVTTIESLILQITADDGFVAYLNGVEIARDNVAGSPPAYNTVATTSQDAFQEVSLDAHKGLLRAGENTFAVQVHNRSLDSSDLTIQPALVSRAPSGSPRTIMKDVSSLQKLVHERGVLSRRQLQAILGEFWENHLTTDYDRVVEHFDQLQNSDASDAMTLEQAEREATQLEFREYEFFYNNAFGNFGDLLLYSASSPTMLIYLDNVLNFKDNPNENYSREIFELSAFGVDNRYLQRDIEVLARAFTGWNICKVAPTNLQPFPASATNPPNPCGMEFLESEVIALGSGWKYLKGTSEPTPDASGGAPTTQWAESGFDDNAWLLGSTGIGYGDGDDATILNDMQNNYMSVYLRRSFHVADPSTLTNLVLEVAYDDAFIAYLNGFEIARSENLSDAGSPPPFNRGANFGHNVEEGAEFFNLAPYRSVIRTGENILAIQVHNVNLNSSDLSMLPRLIAREILPESIENGDADGEWAFHFIPQEHDTGTKTLFQGTIYEITIPARPAAEGLSDALDIVESMVEHPSTAEFICIKLIQKFVSDDISLASFKAGTAPPELVEVLANAIAAWNSTTPRGNIRTVMEAILLPGRSEDRLFWNPAYYRAKVKTPVEFINSTIRALDGTDGTVTLPSVNASMGMTFFTRDDPDGWSEFGFDWIDSGAVLSRIEFVRDQADSPLVWNIQEYLSARGIESPSDVTAYFNELLFQGTLTPDNVTQLIEFLSTDVDGKPSPLIPGSADYLTRMREFVGLLLSLPQWNFQ